MSSTLISSTIKTPLGDMIAIADESRLYILDFADRKNLDGAIKRLMIKTNGAIECSTNPILDLVAAELKGYFAGTLQQFTVPIHFLGTEFQCTTWDVLTKVPYGVTHTYAQQAIAVGNAKAYRAVAHTNSKNTLAIIVPCHRIIASNGTLCGYASGIDRKQWLIDHEKRHMR